MEAYIYKIAVNVIPFIFALTLHEVAHGYVAKLLGDRTAEFQGRLTLNPRPNIDPIGTLLVPAICLIGSPIFFGWAKPIFSDLRNLKNPKRDSMLIALAGPSANLLMLIGWASVFKFVGPLNSAIHTIAAAGVMWNLILAVINLLPILPLDGGKVLLGLLPSGLAVQYARLEPYGFFIVLGLVLSGLLNAILSPIQNGFLSFIATFI